MARKLITLDIYRVIIGGISTIIFIRIGNTILKIKVDYGHVKFSIYNKCCCRWWIFWCGLTPNPEKKWLASL